MKAMRIRRLGWAGIEVVSANGSSLVVDYIHDFALLTATQPHGAYAAHGQPAIAALVTHLHEDHTDIGAIVSAVGPTGLLLRPPALAATAEEATFTEPREADIAHSTLRVRAVADWERVEVGPFTVTAVPAVDGLGDPQVNWVIEADSHRIFHGGDTLFHGYWWLIAQRAGPIDVAVLPINGPVVRAPHLQPPSAVPAVMTPEQAVQAAVILHATTVVPIHFGVHQPPVYVEQDDALHRLAAAADGSGLTVVALVPGASADVPTAS